MGNQHHRPAGPGGGQFTSGDNSGGKLTNAARERVALRAMADKRKLAQGRTSIRNLPTRPSLATRFARQQATGGGGGGQSGGGFGGGHMQGIHKATKGKSLAELSAMDATTATIKPAAR